MITMSTTAMLSTTMPSITQRSIRALHASLGLLLVLITLGLSAAPASAADSAVPGTVNINQATVEQLVLLPRVGPALASRIVEHRKANGKFAKAEDLILVRGIGEKTFKNLEPFVTVEGKTTLDRKLRGADVEAALQSKKPASQNTPSGD